LLNPRKDEKEEKIIMLEQKIKDTIAKAEAAGEEGHVDESQDLTNQVEKMQADLEQLKKNDDVNPIFRQENKMEICHVCGAFLVMNDTSNRLDAHLQGKQHTGYQKIHETYEEMKKQREITIPTAEETVTVEATGTRGAIAISRIAGMIAGTGIGMAETEGIDVTGAETVAADGITTETGTTGAVDEMTVATK
ncbi:Luc7-like protein 3, partial [Modicella reniformis]